MERAANVDDRWATTLAELTEPAEFMNLAATVTGRPGGEADLAVWQAVLRGLGTIALVAPERHAHWATAVADLLAEVVDLLQRPAGAKGRELLGRTRKELPGAVVGDRVRIRQILTNLTENAIRYTDRGRVDVDLGY